MSKSKGQTFRYRFWKRNQNVLVSFLNLSYWKQIVLIWSRIWFPGQYRNDLFRGDKFGKELKSSGNIPIRYWNVCSFTVLTYTAPLSTSVYLGPPEPKYCSICNHVPSNQLWWFNICLHTTYPDTLLHTSLHFSVLSRSLFYSHILL
jgi:hypothetical protein